MGFDHASNNNVQGFVYTTRVTAFKNHRYQFFKRVCKVWAKVGDKNFVTSLHYTGLQVYSRINLNLLKKTIS